MINIKCFQFNPLQENCYVVSDDTGQAAVIDCGAFFDAERQAITDYIKSNRLTLRHVLCTHAHFDHIFGVDTLADSFGVQPRIHAADRFLYDSMNTQVTNMLGVGFNRSMPALGADLASDERIPLGIHELQVLHTPGHSPGSVVFYIKDEKVLFSGDTLFRMSVGRTDLEGGSWHQLLESLHLVVATLPADVTVYTGHGSPTRIADEVLLNPYFIHN